MFTDFFNGSFEVMMKLTNFVIKFTPLGILGIVAAVVAEQADNLNEPGWQTGNVYVCCTSRFSFSCI